MFIEEYKDSVTEFNVQCKICNYKWQTNYAKLKRGVGCPKCARVTM